METHVKDSGFDGGSRGFGVARNFHTCMELFLFFGLHWLCARLEKNVSSRCVKKKKKNPDGGKKKK